MRVSFESKGGFGNATDWLKKLSQPTPSATLEQIAKEGEQALASATPRDTGETASGWFSEVTGQNGVNEIIWKNRAHPESSANVAKLIELGHGTRTGGYVPPQPYIKQAMAPTWKTAGDRLAKELIK